MHTLIAFKHIEIREIRQMTKQYHRHIHLSFYRLHTFIIQHNRIFLLDMNILIIRNHSQDRNATQLFHHFYTRFEEAYVSPELIDNDAFYTFTIFRRLQHDRTIDAGKHPSTINIRHQ